MGLSIVAMGLAGCSTDSTPKSATGAPRATAGQDVVSVLAGTRLWVNPAGHAVQESTRLSTAGRSELPQVVVLEPDAIAHALEGCASTSSAQDRFELLRQAVGILKRQSGVTLYLDAGNASWIKDLDALAGALRASGVAEADGFALNVSNFETTQDSYTYGRQLSQRLQGAHFIIDTSRNGAGAPAGSGTGAHTSWCNPAGIRLGQAPTTNPRMAGVDALLWIKQPGDSDGTCNPGDPPAGTFDLRYAATLLGHPLSS